MIYGEASSSMLALIVSTPVIETVALDPAPRAEPIHARNHGRRSGFGASGHST